jgi:hypothetical protein
MISRFEGMSSFRIAGMQSARIVQGRDGPGAKRFGSLPDAPARRGCPALPANASE